MMKPEERVEILLCDWLITKSEYIRLKDIYFNRKNILNSQIFKNRYLGLKYVY